MQSTATTPTNPLARIAAAIPESAAIAASVGGRLLGGLLLVAIAFDQSYDRTQVFAPVVALLAIASCAPLSPRIAFWVAGLGSGLVFFAGTVLTHLSLGVAVLLAGLVSALATAVWNTHRDHTAWPAAISFLFAAAPLGAIMLTVFFTIKG